MIEKHPVTKQEYRFYPRDNSSDQKAIDEVFKKKIYFKPTIGFVLEPDDVWADLGGNVGAFSVLAGAVSRQVFAFEPEPRNFALLGRHTETLPNVVARRACVMPNSFEGDGIMLNVCESPNHYWMHTVYPTKRKSRQLPVEAVKFQDVLDLGVTAIKMDIEGAEIAILKEQPDLGRVEKMVFEWSFDKDPRIATLRYVLS